MFRVSVCIVIGAAISALPGPLTTPAGAAADRTTGPAKVAVTTAGHHVVCTTPILHPLSVQVTALDPIARGATARLRVTVGAARGFNRGTIQLTSSGGAAAIGTTIAPLRAVPAGGQATAEFTVRVPASGARSLVQFRVSATDDRRSLARGVAFNLMPDGPTERLHAATNQSGEALLETSAGRIQ